MKQKLLIYYILNSLLLIILSIILFLDIKFNIDSIIYLSILIINLICSFLINVNYLKIEDKERFGAKNLIALIFNCLSIVFSIFVNNFFYTEENNLWHFIINFVNIVYLFINYQFYKDSIVCKKNVDNKFEFLSLSPKSEINDCEDIISAIKQSCEHDNIYNIAIDGQYGSGKSSIVKKFLREYQEHSVINISFANFDNKSKDNNLEKIMDVIYEEILIHYVKKPNYYLSFIVTTLLISVLYFVNYSFSFIQINLDLNIVLSIIFAMIYIVLTIVFSTIKRGKIGLGDYSLEIENNELTLETKKLQLIRLIKEYKKNVIFVIEDLDRFHNVDIFSGFRELNFILNQRLPHKIIFLYALDTTLFKYSEERVKFFDIIIPIIPQVSKENIANILKGEIHDDLDTRLIDICSANIRNMREVNNIINEYTIIKKYFFKINKEYYDNNESRNKLFCIVSLKTLFPIQYVELQHNDNYLDNIFTKIMNKKAQNSQLKLSEYITTILCKAESGLEKLLNSENLSYSEIDNIFNEIIILKEDNQKINHGYTYFENNVQKRNFKDFLFHTISIGFLNLDYTEYLTPIIKSKNEYDDDSLYNLDLKMRKKVLFNKVRSEEYAYKFNNPYYVCKTLHHKCFNYISIINYSLILTIFEDVSFSEKKYTFIDTFLKKIDSKNERLKELIFAFINNYDKKRRAFDSFLCVFVGQKSFYEMITNPDDLPLLAKYINIVSTNDSIKNSICSNINSISNLSKLIEINSEDFYDNLNNLHREYFVTGINIAQFNFTKSVILNELLIKHNKFRRSIISCNIYFETHNVPYNKFEHIYNMINNLMLSRDYKNSAFREILNNFSGSENKSLESSIFLNVIYDVLGNIDIFKKIICNNIYCNEYDIDNLKINIIEILITKNILPYEFEYLEKIMNKNDIKLENKIIYVLNHFDEVLKIDDLEIIVPKVIIENIICKMDIKPSVLKLLNDKYSLSKNYSNQITIDNWLLFASEFDQTFIQIEISKLFTCQKEEILVKFSNKGNENFYLEKYKIVYGNRVSSNTKKFVDICLTNCSVVNNEIKEKQPI